MTTHRSLLLPVLLLGLPLAAAAEDANTVPPIVERSIEHHGGDLYRHSTTEMRLCSKSGCFDLRVAMDGDRYDLTVAGEVRGGELRVRSTNDGVSAWRDGEPVAVAPEEEQGYRDFVMARVYFPFLPFRLADPSVRHQDLGVVDWEGKRLHKVKVTFAPGSSTDASDEYVYWLDPETGRVEQLAYSYEGNPGGLRFRRAVDHRRVGGILFFDQENLGVEGKGLTVDAIDPKMVAKKMRHVSTVRLEEVRVTPENPGTPDR